jgi:hypothetical protein
MTARSFLLDVAGGRRRIRVFEAGDGAPLLFLHSAAGLTEDNPFLAALVKGKTADLLAASTMDNVDELVARPIPAGFECSDPVA